ncbi:hypothetical protein [Couchioplanes caeruleus]|uniref:GlsB/YeaQ/YmgE family stress response membrane protein n=1 Tax=Couchioplanes caeruleus TaxID=56438 RepID=A0A3N1GV81_9ACTN|nr:hypothetical protein [Couchioplanes caeruleus]ROP34082.1 hypothetical protein EDD30_7149 [Couchioplanes caeruleus]
MARTVAAAVLGIVAGVIVSLIVFGDDGPGFEIRHVIMALVGLVVAVVAQRVLQTRGPRR